MDFLHLNDCCLLINLLLCNSTRQADIVIMNKLTHLAILLVLHIFMVSCEKTEQPYPLPTPGSASFDKVDIGDNYELHVFYSFTNGIIKTDSFEIWDFCFTQSTEEVEIWLNGGKGNLIYQTTSTDFAATQNNIPNHLWKYDEPTWILNKSAYGILSGEDLDYVYLLKTNSNTYKFKVNIADDPNGIQVQWGRLNDEQGQTTTLLRDPHKSYLYFSTIHGSMDVEPQKTEWDVWFTRYRHIFYGANPDGSDMPYFVNGVLLNPYQTQGAADTLTARDFDELDLEEAMESYRLTNQRDIIGYHWKEVNINNGEYKVLPERVYLVEDQLQQLWKLRFVNFYESNGQKGKPQFEFQQLR